MKKIVIFGGTTEGRRLSKLLAEAGALVTVCVATEYGEEEQGTIPGVMTRIGPLSAEEKQTLLCDAALCVDATHPYASHVTGSVKTACKEAGVEFFAPVEVIRSLLFLRCTENEFGHFLIAHGQGIYVYRQAGSQQPAVIRDHEMEVFRFVVTAGQQGLTLLGEDRPEYHQGDRVVVTDGPFKGAEGHIKRIKKDRRLVVTIPGVVAVATAFIHPSMLKKKEDADPKTGTHNKA